MNFVEQEQLFLIRKASIEQAYGISEVDIFLSPPDCKYPLIIMDRSLKSVIAKEIFAAHEAVYKIN